MCRMNQARGFCCMAFGLGLLVGKCLTSAFLCNCCGVVLLLVGFWLLRKK